jgi:hypothetical protein
MSTLSTTNQGASTPLSGDDYRNASEQLWKSYDTINEWIRFADAKAGALLTFNGVVMAAALGAVKEIRAVFVAHHFLLWLGATCGACFITSAVFSLHCILPTVKIKLGASEPKGTSIIFFEHIAQRKGVGEFLDDVLKVRSSEDTCREIAAQVHAVSIVASRKHREIYWSVVTLGIGLALGVALLVVLAFVPQTPAGGKP